jgi:hypothetical protein
MCPISGLCQPVILIQYRGWTVLRSYPEAATGSDLLDRTSVNGPRAINWMRRQGPGALTLSGI